MFQWIFLTWSLMFILFVFYHGDGTIVTLDGKTELWTNSEYVVYLSDQYVHEIRYQMIKA